MDDYAISSWVSSSDDHCFRVSDCLNHCHAGYLLPNNSISIGLLTDNSSQFIVHHASFACKNSTPSHNGRMDTACVVHLNSHETACPRKPPKSISKSILRSEKPSPRSGTGLTNHSLPWRLSRSYYTLQHVTTPEGHSAVLLQKRSVASSHTKTVLVANRTSSKGGKFARLV